MHIIWLIFFIGAKALALPVVETLQGGIEGVDKGSHTVYLGIPYAKAPIGDLRWRPPQDPEPFTEIYKADTYGSESLQRLPGANGMDTGRIIGSEDCLYLNVYVPKNRDHSKQLPVIFWIHGGAYVFGSGNQKIGSMDLYNPTRLVNEGKAIFVSHNYRLGAMGFFSHPDLLKESGTTGNYGILDTIKALEWVKKNIAAFGGNPNNITIKGESAGGATARVMVASKLTKNLFQRAMILSGPDLEEPLEERYKQADYIRKKLKVRASSKSLQRLREIPAEEFVRQFPLKVDGPKPEVMLTYGPTIDGHVLKHGVLESIQRGEHNRNVDAFINTNSGEMELLSHAFMTDVPKEMSPEEFHDYLERFVRDPLLTEKITKYYEKHNYPKNKQSLKHILGDLMFHAPARMMAEYMELHKPGSTYLSLYDKKAGMFEAGHALELFYIFNRHHFLMPLTFEWKPYDILLPVNALFRIAKHIYNEHQFSRRMRRYVYRYARHGNPNKTNSKLVDPKIPKFRTGKMFVHHDQPKVVSGYRDNFISFLKGIYESRWQSPKQCRGLFGS